VDGVFDGAVVVGVMEDVVGAMEVLVIIGACEVTEVVSAIGRVLFVKGDVLAAMMHFMLCCPPYDVSQQANCDVNIGRPLGTGSVLMHFPSGQGRV
jgi:hypothetical protein